MTRGERVKSLKSPVLIETEKNYGTKPDFPFEDDFDTAVLRHSDSRKWYGLIMSVPKRKLGNFGDEVIDILNLKCDPLISGGLIAENKVFPAYDMNKEKWISLPLDGSLPLTEIMPLVEISYILTANKKRACRK